MSNRHGIIRLFVAAVAALAWSAASFAATCERVVALGDLHGGYENFVTMLTETAVIDGDLDWSGGDACYVQVGDVVDRGARSREILDLIMKLENQAPGRVYFVLGNHEVMNITDDLRYVDPGEFTAFAGEETAEQREKGLAAFVQGLEEPPEDLETAFAERYPAGWFAHRVAFSPHGRYGAWLLSKPTILVLDGTVFVHGGITPAIAAMGTEVVNDEVIEEIRRYLSHRAELVNAGVLDPLAEFGESFLGAEAWYQRWKALPRKERKKTAEIAKKVERFDELRRALFISPRGPLWNRDLSVGSETDHGNSLTEALRTLGADRVVVGHTPTSDGKIAHRFDNRVFVVDTGSGPYYGGHASALEIARGGVRAVYPHESVVLVAGDFPAAVIATGTTNGHAVGSTSNGHVGTESPSNGHPSGDEKKGYDRDDGATDEEIEHFLREAKIVATKDLGSGTTKPLKVTLEMGGVQRYAVFKDVNVEKRGVTKFEDGTVAFNFTDKYHYDRAAYLLDRRLEMYMVPVSVFRGVGNRSGVLTEWVSGAITEGDRRARGIEPADSLDFETQKGIMDVFDALIHNDDRNLGNIMILEESWDLRLIDHSRAFRTIKGLPEKFAGSHAVLSPEYYEQLKTLEADELKPLLKGMVSGSQIKTMLKRRDLIVEKIEADRAKFGDSFVLKERRR
jgi:hypothetical protein